MDMVTFTEEILNGKLHFLCSVKRELNEELMPIAWYPKKWWKSGVSKEC